MRVVLTPLLGVRRPGPRPWRHRLPSLPAPSRAGSGPTTLPPLRQTRSATPRGAVVNLHGFPELGEVYVGGIGPVWVDGSALAGIVNKIEYFHRARGGDHGPITLLPAVLVPSLRRVGWPMTSRRLESFQRWWCVYAPTDTVTLGMLTPDLLIPDLGARDHHS
jgi:hypothetical protein